MYLFINKKFLRFLILLYPKYKNAAYEALATHAPVASASDDMTKMSLLLPLYRKIRTIFKSES